MKASIKIGICMSILFIVLLLGCRTKNITKNYSLNEAKGKGVIIVSLTVSGESRYAARVYLRGLDNSYADYIPIKGASAPSDFWKEPVSGDIPSYEPCGRLAIIELSQGEYEFDAFIVEKGLFRSFYKYKLINPFRVIAGKAVYLGNIHILIRKRRFTVTMYDMRYRDMPMLNKKNPNITPDKVIFNILNCIDYDYSIMDGPCYD